MMIQFQPNLIAEFGLNPVIDLRGELPVNPAYSWAELTGIRKPEALTTIVVHHDALAKGKYEGVSDLELATRIAKGHMNNKIDHPEGEPGFPYDIWIRNGQVYLCNDPLPLKYGVSNNNGYTYHICVSGEYKYTDAMTDGDRNALIAAILMMQNIEELPNLKDIKGHGELRPTDCPGIDMKRLRHDVLDAKIRLEAKATLEARRGFAYQVTQQTEYLYSLIGKNDGNEQWALHYFDKFYELMKKEGWFK